MLNNILQLLKTKHVVPLASYFVFIDWISYEIRSTRIILVQAFKTWTHLNWQKVKINTTYVRLSQWHNGKSRWTRFHILRRGRGLVLMLIVAYQWNKINPETGTGKVVLRKQFLWIPLTGSLLNFQWEAHNREVELLQEKGRVYEIRTRNFDIVTFYSRLGIELS